MFSNLDSVAFSDDMFSSLDQPLVFENMQVQEPLPLGEGAFNEHNEVQLADLDSHPELLFTTQSETISDKGESGSESQEIMEDSESLEPTPERAQAQPTAAPSKSSNGRGRPRNQINVSTEELIVTVQNWIRLEFQKASEALQSSKTQKKRDRYDTLRTKLVRITKKVI